jgi:hypothetical protein
MTDDLQRSVDEVMSTCRGCDRRVHAKGLCSTHYHQQRVAAAPPCSECGRRVHARGMCALHYMQWIQQIKRRLKERGFSLATSRASLLKRFLAKRRRMLSGCWEWSGVKRGGYGQMRIDGCTLTAHRVGYELLVGPVPEGLDLDHLCRNRSCVNPAHLEPVTRSENVRRGLAPARMAEVARVSAERRRARTHCKRGHPLSGTNLYMHSSDRRYCRPCQVIRHRRYRAAAQQEDSL